MTDILAVARDELRGEGTASGGRELAEAVVDMTAVLRTIVVVGASGNKAMQQTILAIAEATVRKWGVGAARRDAPFPTPTNRSLLGTDKGG